MSAMEKIWAVRGATSVKNDTPAEILQATEELLITIFRENGIRREDTVSIIFTVTPDITSEFPAVAARKIGLTDTPLICAQEIAKPGSLPLCIRVLVHFYTKLKKTAIKPVYLREARSLRPDLTGQI